jgi:hypothetical protein
MLRAYFTPRNYVIPCESYRDWPNFDFLRLLTVGSIIRAMGTMHPATTYETADAIVSSVREIGTITKHTLAKWHRAGLIPIPKTVPLGHGKGSESRYPIGTLHLVIEILKRRKSRCPKLEDLAWDLWWAGFDVPIEAIRKRLDYFVAEWDKSLKTNDLDRELKELETRRLPSPVGKIRRRVGRAKIRPVANAILSVVSDRVDESAIDQVDDETYVKAFKLQRGRKERTTDAGPLVQTPQAEIMHFLGAILRGRSLVQTLAAYSDPDITSSRDAFKWLLGVVEHAGSQTGGMFGKGAFGFDALRALGTATDWKQQALLIILWPLFMANPEFKRGFETYLDSEEKLKAADRAFDQVRLLKQEIPALARVATPKRIGSGLKNRKKQAKLNAELRRIKKRHGPEIDAFFARHGGVTNESPGGTGSGPEKRASTDQPNGKPKRV